MLDRHADDEVVVRRGRSGGWRWTGGRSLWVPAVRRGAASPVARVHATHRAREVDGVVYLLSLFGLWVLNAADMAVTLVWIDGAGWGAEGNDWMRFIAERGGTFGFVVYKLALMTLIVTLLWGYFQHVEGRVRTARARKDRQVAGRLYLVLAVATGGLIGFYVWVLVNNLHIAGLL